MNKRDIVAIAAALLLTALSFIVFMRSEAPGSTVIIKLDGKLYGSYSLSENQRIEIKESNAHNTVVIEGNSVRMENSDCPDLYCVKQGRITRSGESIICLPHRLSVELVSDQSEIDAVAR